MSARLSFDQPIDVSVAPDALRMFTVACDFCSAPVGRTCKQLLAETLEEAWSSSDGVSFPYHAIRRAPFDIPVPLKRRPCPVAGCVGHSTVVIGGSKLEIHASTEVDPDRPYLFQQPNRSAPIGVDVASVESHERFGPVISDRHARLVAYLMDKVVEGDWHAVSDAANDLRVMEASRR